MERARKEKQNDFRKIKRFQKIWKDYKRRNPGVHSGILSSSLVAFYYKLIGFARTNIKFELLLM